MPWSSWRPLRREKQGLVRLPRLVAAVAVVFTVDCWRLSDAQDVSFGPGEMPGCDQSVVTRLLRDAIAKSPPDRSFGVAVLGVASISESESRDDEKRVCAATVFTSTGNYQVTYTVEWVDGTGKSAIRLSGNVLSRFL